MFWVYFFTFYKNKDSGNMESKINSNVIWLKINKQNCVIFTLHNFSTKKWNIKENDEIKRVTALFPFPSILSAPEFSSIMNLDCEVYALHNILHTHTHAHAQTSKEFITLFVLYKLFINCRILSISFSKLYFTHILVLTFICIIHINTIHSNSNISTWTSPIFPNLF